MTTEHGTTAEDGAVVRIAGITQRYGRTLRH